MLFTTSLTCPHVQSDTWLHAKKAAVGHHAAAATTATAAVADLDLPCVQCLFTVQQVSEVTVQALQYHVYVICTKSIDDVLEPAGQSTVVSSQVNAGQHLRLASRK